MNNNQAVSKDLLFSLFGSSQFQEGMRAAKRFLIQTPVSGNPKFDVINVLSPTTNLMRSSLNDMLAAKKFSSLLPILDDWHDVVALIQPDHEKYCAGVLGSALPFYYSKIAQATDSLETHEKSIKCLELALSFSSFDEVVKNAARAYRLLAVYYADQDLWKKAEPLLFPFAENILKS